MRPRARWRPTVGQWVMAYTALFLIASALFSLAIPDLVLEINP